MIRQGQWEDGDPDILVVFDVGYDVPRVAYLLTGLPIEVLGRMRSDRVMRRPTPTQLRYALAYPRGGRPPKHGKEFRSAKPDTWGEPHAEAVQGRRPLRHRPGDGRGPYRPPAHHPLRVDRPDHDGELPIIKGTLIRLTLDPAERGSDTASEHPADLRNLPSRCLAPRPGGPGIASAVEAGPFGRGYWPTNCW
ncbi:transposase [Streptomyces sp. NBC_00237]|nr:transposase [Streptomyces sp. NBC_00237]